MTGEQLEALRAFVAKHKYSGLVYDRRPHSPGFGFDVTSGGMLVDNLVELAKMFSSWHLTIEPWDNGTLYVAGECKRF